MSCWRGHNGPYGNYRSHAPAHYSRVNDSGTIYQYTRAAGQKVRVCIPCNRLRGRLNVAAHRVAIGKDLPVDKGTIAEIIRSVIDQEISDHSFGWDGDPLNFLDYLADLRDRLIQHIEDGRPLNVKKKGGEN